MITIVIDNLDECRREWHRAELAIGDGTVNGVKLGLKEGAEEALRTRRWRNRSGDTARATRGVVEFATQGGAVGVLECAVPWASFLADGTRPHEIWPKAIRGSKVSERKPGQTLRARNDIGTTRVALRIQLGGGQVIFRRMVHHKGTKPDAFMANGLQKCERVMVREVELGVVRAQTILDQ